MWNAISLVWNAVSLFPLIAFFFLIQHQLSFIQLCVRIVLLCFKKSFQNLSKLIIKKQHYLQKQVIPTWNQDVYQKTQKGPK